MEFSKVRVYDKSSCSRGEGKIPGRDETRRASIRGASPLAAICVMCPDGTVSSLHGRPRWLDRDRSRTHSKLLFFSCSPRAFSVIWMCPTRCRTNFLQPVKKFPSVFRPQDRNNIHFEWIVSVMNLFCIYKKNIFKTNKYYITYRPDFINDILHILFFNKFSNKNIQKGFKMYNTTKILLYAYL